MSGDLRLVLISPSSLLHVLPLGRLSARIPGRVWFPVRVCLLFAPVLEPLLSPQFVTLSRHSSTIRTLRVVER